MGLPQVKQVNPKKIMSPTIEVKIGKLAKQVNPVNIVKKVELLNWVKILIHNDTVGGNLK